MPQFYTFITYTTKCISYVANFIFISSELIKLQTYKVAVTERLICTVSIGKTNYRCLLKQMYVTYEWSAVHTRNFHHSVCHKLRNGLLSKLFLFLSWVALNKVEINEETLITSNHFDVTWTNSHNLLTNPLVKQRNLKSSCLGKKVPV